jgi:hypothetical protein
MVYFHSLAEDDSSSYKIWKYHILQSGKSYMSILNHFSSLNAWTNVCIYVPPCIWSWLMVHRDFHTYFAWIFDGGQMARPYIDSFDVAFWAWHTQPSLWFFAGYYYSLINDCNPYGFYWYYWLNNSQKSLIIQFVNHGSFNNFFCRLKASAKYGTKRSFRKKNPAPNGIASQKDLIVEQRVIRFFCLENEHYIYHIYSLYNKMNIV